MTNDVFTSRDGAGTYSPSALKWAVKTGGVQRVARAAYVESAEETTTLEEALAIAAAAHGVSAGLVAAKLLGLDAPAVVGPCFVVAPRASGRRAGARRYELDPRRVVLIDGCRVTNGLQTLLDLAAELADWEWEQVLESVLRKRLASIGDIEAALPAMSRARTKGVRRIRRVLARRPPGAPPTESLLETLMVQLVREMRAPDPTRQLPLYDEHGQFVARPDLCWPELGVFVELDGQHHLGQPVYDANRETRIVAATGWLCARFTWDEVRRNPTVTGRRLLRVLEQAARRPVSRAAGAAISPL
jgi:hypothetical protein